jgi:hypothetical protein
MQSVQLETKYIVAKDLFPLLNTFSAKYDSRHTCVYSQSVPNMAIAKLVLSSIKSL